MKTVLTFVFFLLLSTRSQGGDIVGTVRAQGRAEAGDDTTGGNYESRKFKFAERVNYGELKDFVVYIEGTIPGTKPPQGAQPIVTQKDATFKPHVLPIMVGTTVSWPNRDSIFHNVFSKSTPKPFDLGLYSSSNDKDKELVFNQLGQVDVFCSIHAKMHCIILVLENPCFASVNEKNHYSITNVPPGHYKITAWHERLPNLTKEITVPENGNVKLDFLMGIVNLPKY